MIALFLVATFYLLANFTALCIGSMIYDAVQIWRLW